ncbi:hypothetical protein DPMN_077252 [Dreissena polymorpha]|uniref:Uncharacterized protein n=1 Tax=Dreissena polymorpha TaxID=45954 RepID=A0A9D4BN44_DREPO|nr:hypothetical protein DPMN_077252 [Dreissena polymorpha]
MIEEMHQAQHSTLGEIAKNTSNETKHTRSNLQASLKTGVDTCIIHYPKLKLLHEALQYSSDKNKKKLLFIASWKCVEKLLQVDICLEENLDKLEHLILDHPIRDTGQYLSKLSGKWTWVQSSKTVTYHANTDIAQYLYRLENLGRNILSNYVFSVAGQSEHNAGCDGHVSNTVSGIFHNLSLQIVVS